MNLVSRFHKSVLFKFSYFEELLTLEYLLLKIQVWSQSVGVARWVRPAISMLRTSFSCGLGQEWEYDCMLFLLEVLLCDNVLCLFFFVFLIILWLCPFFKNQTVFGLGLSCDFFLCFIISF